MGLEMPRAPNRLSPLPIDEKQLVDYLELVSRANQVGIYDAEEISQRGVIEIKQKSGSKYKPGVIKSVIRNLTRLGFFIDSNRSLSLSSASRDFIDDEMDVLDKKGSYGVPKVGHLLLQCMEDLGPGGIDPYIADQLAFFFDVIRKEDVDTKWTNELLLDKSSNEVNQIEGFVYGGFWDSKSKSSKYTPGVKRIAQEYLKMLGILGVISKQGKYWRIVKDEAVQGHVRNRLHSLRFQEEIEWIIKKLGPEHRLFSEKGNFFRSIGRYITYRYSSGIGRQAGLRDDLLRDIERIRSSLESRYIEQADKRVHAGRTARAYIKDLRGLFQKRLRDGISESELDENSKAALAAMSLHELEKMYEDENDHMDLSDLLRSRGSGRYNRLSLKRIQHHEGPFKITETLEPHRWQRECVDIWAKGDPLASRDAFTGTASAVTGTGKTVMALMAISRFVQLNPRARVSVVVPTKVLMYQWAEEASKFLGLGPDELGFVGDGFSDSFSDRRMIVWIVDSAVKNDRMKAEIESLEDQEPHLLIADECHEYGGEIYRSFLDSRSEGRLAISATPPDQTAEGERHPVLKKMGPIFYSLDYRRAHSEGLIAGFSIRYLRIELSPAERSEYTRYTEEIRRLNRELDEMFGPQIEGGNRHARLRSMQKSGDGNPTIDRLLKVTDLRKDVVRNASRRDVAAVAIANYVKEEREDFTYILFHERINETTLLISDAPGETLRKLEEEAKRNNRLEEAKYIADQHDSRTALQSWALNTPWISPAMYHSKFPERWKNWMVNWFREERLNLMLSARALAQGFDMPGADVGAIRSSTSNVRQRIQTIGRMIRKKDGKEGAEIWIVFVRDTTDERIFQNYDWEGELPEVDNVQTLWELGHYENATDAKPIEIDIKELPQPDRELTEDELQSIDVEGLGCGDDYPDRRAIHSTSESVWVDESGAMTVMDEGAPFDFSFNPLLESARWVHEKRGRGKIHVLANGHAVTRSRLGRVVFLADIELSDFLEAITTSVDEGDDYDTFMSAFQP